MSASGFAYRDRGTVRTTNLEVTTAPAEEPVTVALVKQHCRIDTDVDDSLLELYATSARMMVEQYLDRVLITQGLTWTIQEMDPRRTEALLWMPTELTLPRGKVQSVTTVTTRDADGADAVADPAYYTLDATLVPALLRFTLGVIQGQLQHVKVVYVAGYGLTSAVPKPIINAVLLTTAFLYEHRGDLGADLPPAAEWLCNPYRVHSFGS